MSKDENKYHDRIELNPDNVLHDREIIDILRKMKGIRSTIEELSGTLGMLRDEMWDKVFENYPKTTNGAWIIGRESNNEPYTIRLKQVGKEDDE